MQISVENVTPKIASEYLKRNTMNRPINQSHLKTVCKMMREGKWASNGDTIRFAQSGELLDGQHRLMAVCQTGVPQEMIIVRGLDVDVFTTIDSGAKRTSGDILSLAGYKNYNALAAASRMALLVQRGGHPFFVHDKSYAPTSDEILEFVQSNPLMIEATEFSRSLNFLRKLMSPSSTAYLYYAAASIGEADKIKSFLHNVNEVSPESIKTTAYMLRERLIENKSAREKMRRPDVLALAIKAYRHFREGRTVKILKVASKGATKEKGVFEL